MKVLGHHPGSLRRSVLGLVVVSALALGIGVAGGSGSDGLSGAQSEVSIPKGFDLFQTDPEQTVFRFRDQTAIPADFFAPGSERFEGDVRFGGVPIGRFRGKDAGDADTAVQRGSASLAPGASTSEPVRIEVVRLSLASMAPLEVKVGGETQLWDARIEVSPIRPSTGEMTIARPEGSFGQFSSRLVVYPKFTFTRRAAAGLRKSQQSKALDVGALPDGIRPSEADLAFTAQNVPWRRGGCVEPALAGLNTSFCPGLAQGGHGAEPPANTETTAHKELTEHESRYAEHGIWPVQPRLEHFACYSVSESDPPFVPRNQFGPRRGLLDQFGESDAALRVVARDRLCNPARKNAEAFVNKKAHLRCYVVRLTSGGALPARNVDVAVRNQLGAFRLRIREAQRLCLPSTKQRLNGPAPIPPIFVTEHFQCYRVTPLDGDFRPRTRKFTDQFVEFKIKLRAPSRLCAPVQKSGKFPVQHHVNHLACYRVSGPTRRRRVIVRNQYTEQENNGRPLPETLRTRAVREVCVPSVKTRLP